MIVWQQNNTKYIALPRSKPQYQDDIDQYNKNARKALKHNTGLSQFYPCQETHQWAFFSPIHKD